MVLLQFLCVVLVTTTLVTCEEFQMDIEEQGTEFTENIKLDEETNTEIIEVPHHNQVAATTFIHDFNRNLTLRVIKATGACFVTDLSDMIDHGFLVPPKQLKAHLKAGQHKARSQRSLSPDNSEVEVILQEWAMGRLLDEDEVASLSDTQREACPTNKIRWLFRLRDSAVVRGGSERAQHTSHSRSWGDRHRRDIFDPKCPAALVKYRCKKELLSCQYIYYETCDAERFRRGRRMYAKCLDNSTLHIIDEVKCCRECCNDESQADDFFPFCETFGEFQCTHNLE